MSLEHWLVKNSDRFRVMCAESRRAPLGWASALSQQTTVGDSESDCRTDKCDATVARHPTVGRRDSPADPWLWIPGPAVVCWIVMYFKYSTVPVRSPLLPCFVVGTYVCIVCFKSFESRV